MMIATFLFGWFSSSADTVEGARLLAWTWDDTAIALSVDRSALSGMLKRTRGAEPVVMSTDGGTYHRYTLPEQTLDGVAVGSSWRLIGPSGERQCTVTGLAMIVAPGATLDGSLGTGAPCAEPLVFADIDCGEGDLPWDAVAVPAASRARAAQAGEAVSIETPTGAHAAILRDSAVQAVRADASSRAAEQGAVLRTELSTQTHTLGAQSFVAVEGRFVTGMGDDACGGVDVAEEWSGLLIDDTPRGMHAAPDGRMLGVFDLDGDGSPETLERDINGTVLRGADGKIIRRHDGEWCVCGC